MYDATEAREVIELYIIFLLRGHFIASAPRATRYETGQDVGKSQQLLIPQKLSDGGHIYRSR
jgi:hypothetical protein